MFDRGKFSKEIILVAIIKIEITIADSRNILIQFFFKSTVEVSGSF